MDLNLVKKKLLELHNEVGDDERKRNNLRENHGKLQMRIMTLKPVI